VTPVIKSQSENTFDGQRDVRDEAFVPGASCGVDLTTALAIDPCDDANGDFVVHEPNVEFGKPLQDWFEMALRVESPARKPAKASWGEEEDETEEEPAKEDSDEDDSDPFEDFDEDDFDDDFDDDFEEELDDEYEIEPADDGLVSDADVDSGSEILDEDEEVGPGLEEID